MGYSPTLAHRHPPRNRAASLRRQAASGDRALAGFRHARVQGRDHRQHTGAAARAPAGREARRARHDRLAGDGEAPRRLGHGEEATLEEHLEELRGRLFVMLGAVVVGDGRRVRLPRPHPRLARTARCRRSIRPVTLGVAEPFTITITVCLYAGLVARAAGRALAAVELLRAGRRGAVERKILVLVVCSVVLGAAGVAFGYEILLPRAVHFLTNYDTSTSTT